MGCQRTWKYQKKSLRAKRSNLTMFLMKSGYVYFLMNKSRSVIYVGVTSNLNKRIYEHREGGMPGFTKKYGVHHLVYYEIFDLIEDAIAREKQIKAGSRKRKLDLIRSFNPTFKDLYDTI
jgi:putative endonuclease